MKVNAEADLLQAVKDDPRKTKVGDFLRRTNLDEFPQFINVLFGSMPKAAFEISDIFGFEMEYEL